MTISSNQVILLAVTTGVLLWLVMDHNRRKKKKEEYTPDISPFLTGTYQDISGKTRLDLCTDDCKGWLNLPPFDRHTKYCIRECVRTYGLGGGPAI